MTRAMSKRLKIKSIQGALDITSNCKWGFKGYEDHGLEHFWRIVIRKLVYIFGLWVFF